MGDEEKKFLSPAFTLAFDEINGLQWNDKLEQQRNSYHRLKKVLDVLKINHPDYIEETHLLMYLYSIYQSKDIIRSIYHRYFSKMNQERIKNIFICVLKHPFYVFSRLKKLKSLRKVKV